MAEPPRVPGRYFQTMAVPEGAERELTINGLGIPKQWPGVNGAGHSSFLIKDGFWAVLPPTTFR